MFFIVNKTRGHVSLGDMGITLGPRQAVDLDKIMKRSKSEGSQSLKAARAKGDVEVRVKDRIKEKDVQPAIDRSEDMNLGSLKKEIIGEMKNTMKEFLSSQNGGISKEDLKEILSALPKSSETVIYRQEQEKIKEDEDVDMDEEMLAKINARTVDNIVKNTEAKSVKYEEKHEENTILNNVDELMDLL